MISLLKSIGKFYFTILLVLLSNGWAQYTGSETVEYEDKNLEKIKLELGPDWKNTVLEKVKLYDPLAFEDIMDFKTKAPLMYEKALAQLWTRYNNIEIMKQNELEHQCQKLASDYQDKNNKSQKNEIMVELKNKLTELFDLREAKKLERIKKLETELVKLKEMVNLREKNKKKIIEKRLNELLAQDRVLQW